MEPIPSKKSKFDSIILGTIVGIVVPIISILVFYYSAFSKVSLQFFIEHTKNINVLGKLISVGAVPNLGVFFLFMWRNHLLSARGIILATLILAFLILIMNFNLLT